MTRWHDVFATFGDLVNLLLTRCDHVPIGGCDCDATGIFPDGTMQCQPEGQLCIGNIRVILRSPRRPTEIRLHCVRCQKTTMCAQLCFPVSASHSATTISAWVTRAASRFGPAMLIYLRAATTRFACMQAGCMLPADSHVPVPKWFDGRLTPGSADKFHGLVRTFYARGRIG